MKTKKQVERETQYLDLDLPFNVGNVPEFFQVLALMRGKMHGLRVICIDICDEYCTMKFNQVEVRFEKIDNTWMLSYKNGEEPIKIDDPEKSIIDHLWFVLKDPRLRLGSIMLKIEKTDMDLERLNLLFQSMLDSIDHQIRTGQLHMSGFNEDTLFSLLKRINPKKFTRIDFNIAWKKDGNYQKLEEIVELDQWKQASYIYTDEFTYSKINDLLHCSGRKLQYKYC
ncbi:hypothetical protein CAEBREN_21132 [Caenorhabditis brenneri]|uniref:DUF38 domain-containing protein n=1 Tax=Caenorhabditis brenneri TaxID=135651 RepID=G0P289_CAEBE|nr:hypothetical protein CAEBREN_21132 [Caenorhabditis brenneri]